MNRNGSFRQHCQNVTAAQEGNAWQHEHDARVRDNLLLREHRDAGGSCKSCTHSREAGLYLRCKPKVKEVKHYNICHLYKEKANVKSS